MSICIISVYIRRQNQSYICYMDIEMIKTDTYSRMHHNHKLVHTRNHSEEVIWKIVLGSVIDPLYSRYSATSILWQITFTVGLGSLYRLNKVVWFCVQTYSMLLSVKRNWAWRRRPVNWLTRCERPSVWLCTHLKLNIIDALMFLYVFSFLLNETPQHWMPNKDAHWSNSYDLVCFCILPHGMTQPENCICPTFISVHLASLHKFVYVVKTQLWRFIFWWLLFSPKNSILSQNSITLTLQNRFSS